MDTLLLFYFNTVSQGSQSQMSRGPLLPLSSHQGPPKASTLNTKKTLIFKKKKLFIFVQSYKCCVLIQMSFINQRTTNKIIIHHYWHLVADPICVCVWVLCHLWPASQEFETPGLETGDYISATVQWSKVSLQGRVSGIKTVPGHCCC